MYNFIWALIIVSETANVSFSSGYPTEGLCRDALSIARTGMTVEEKRLADAEENKLALERRAEYQATHPPRATISEDEKKCYDGRTGMSVGASFDFCIMQKDNLTYFYEGGGSYATSYRPEHKIKYAKCVLVPASEK